MGRIKQLSVIVLVLLGLLSGTVRALFFPLDINTYETRPANKLPHISYSAFLSGQYQDDFESALSDQVPMSQYFKKAYNELSSLVVELGVKPLLRVNPDTIISYNGTKIYRDHMLYTRYDFENLKSVYDIVVNSYKNALQANPEVDFNFYYIESDTCCDVITGEKNSTYQYLKETLGLSDEHIGRLEINSFEDFQQYFRKTDHHWNHKGSYKAYLEILDLLDIKDAPLSPAEEKTLNTAYVGTKGMNAKLPSFTETPDVYFFDYPDLGLAYGNEDLYRNGSLSELTYSSFYGGDMGEMIFNTGIPENENLLVLGDSFDNAILKLLASHFEKTHCIDLRYYYSNGESGLNITEYIKNNNIDKVLVVGSDFLFADPTFAVRS